MRVGLGVFMDEDQCGSIEHVAVAFRYRLQLGDQVGELLHVPTADIAEYALAFGSVGPAHLALGVGVIVMARRGVA